MNRRDDERGAVIVLLAMTLIGLLILSAIVVDLGLLRAQRRENQSAADLSALAAGSWLSGRGGLFAAMRPQSACDAALLAAKSNIDDFPPSATLNCTVLPALGSDPFCHGGTPAVTVAAAGTSPYTLEITYPLPASEISQPGFSGGSGVGDGTRCQRMEVVIGFEQDSMFAGVLGVDSLDTEVRAVVQGATDGSSERVPAFLILARSDCRVLTNSAGGAGNLGIIVSAASATEGGAIHTDTDASDCGGNTTDYGIYADPLSGGDPGIKVEDSVSGDPGVISSYAVAAGSSRALAQFPGGVSHDATVGEIISRQPIDRRYNPSFRTAIEDLHSEARTRVFWSAATASANGYAVLGCGDDNGTWTDVKVFVDCSTWSPKDVRLPNATDVITTGQVELNNNRLLHLPLVERFYVRGCPACTGANQFGIRVDGELYVNTGSEPIGAATCDNRTGPGAGGTTTNYTQIVMFGSRLDVSGDAYLCQTTVYLGEEAASYTRRTATSGLPNCSSDFPCPVGSVLPASNFAMSGYAEWTAPNQTTTVPTATHPFEDLAMWTESSDTSDIKSGGILLTSGVFYGPNMRVEFRSPASGQPRDSQFIVHSFAMLQGTLKMAPSPANAVGLESVGDYSLIR